MTKDEIKFYSVIAVMVLAGEAAINIGLPCLAFPIILAGFVILLDTKLPPQ